MKTDEKTPPPENTERGIVEFVPYGTKDKIKLSIAIVKRLVAVKTKSGKSCSDEDAFKFMLMCQARKLNPFEGDAFLIGYDSQTGPSFSLITAHQAFLKRAELHPEFDGLESGTIVMRDKDILDLLGDWHMSGDKILGGWATVYFKNRKFPMKKRLRLDRFNKNYGIWRDDPAGMIVKCAEADALRSSFPTMLGGMFISEELKSEVTIGAPVFEETTPPSDNGKKTEQVAETVRAEVVEKEPALTPGSTTPIKQAAEVEKKKPTLTRKSAARSTETERTTKSRATQLSDRDKLKEMLAIGNCTTADFADLAVSEGWIEREKGTWDEIPDERFAEFLKDENWSFIMQLLDERRAEPTTTEAAAPAATPAAEKSKATQSDRLL